MNLFGSRAKGNYKSGSDIDLVVMNQGVTDKTLISLATDFYESSLPYRVDLVYFPEPTNHDLIDHIKRKSKLFYVR